MTDNTIQIRALAAHPETLPVLTSWLQTEWPDWYGAKGNGDAKADLIAYSNVGSVPMGMVAFADNKPCGFMALKSEAISDYSHLSPWVGAGFVIAPLRNRGIGGRLLNALEGEAKQLGYTQIYCGTTQANNLLNRAGWRVMSQAKHNGENVTVYAKTLA